MESIKIRNFIAYFANRIQVMSLLSLFAKQPVLTIEEIRRYALHDSASGSSRTVDSLLTYHVKQGHLVRVKRGLYLTVPTGSDPETCPFDPFLIAAKATTDSVVAYHSALEFFDRAYSTFQRTYFFTSSAMRPFRFRSFEFCGVKFPKTLVTKGKQDFGIKRPSRSGQTIRVASLERTLVDVLDRPDLGGGWEEVWRSLESVEYFDLEVVVEYALLLENATTAAKLGFFLEQHQERLMVDQRDIAKLEERRPRSPHYVDRKGDGGKFVAKWNLVVPEFLVDLSWEEA